VVTASTANPDFNGVVDQIDSVLAAGHAHVKTVADDESTTA